MSPQQAHQAWLQAAEKVKDRVIVPTLYRALELGVGVTMEGDEFVLGFSNADYPMAGHLRASQHQAIIEQCLSEVIGRKVRLRVVEGTTLEEYESYKQRLAAAEASRETIATRKEREREVEEIWDRVAERITRGYARLPLRQLAQSKGLFIKQAFGIINEAVNQLGYDETSDELQKRALSRVFDRFATAVDVPGALLAYEFFRLREEGKLS